MTTKMRWILLCLAMLLSLLGCGSGQAEPAQTTPPETPVIPAAYEEILPDYETVVDFRLSDTFESDYNSGKTVELSDALTVLDEELGYRWHCMMIEMLPWGSQFTKASFGYALKDLNADGIPELFWVREDGFILAVFTVSDGEARLLDAYWTRHSGVLADSDYLLTMSNSGATCTQYKVNEISADGTGLTAVAEFGVDGDYYEMIGGEKVTVDEARFQELQAAYSSENDNDWEIVSLA